jgi:hypothetical protein
MMRSLETSFYPVVFGIEPSDAFSCFGIFQEPLAIVDDPPKVELVIENSDPSQPIAVDRRGIPLAATRTRNRLAIKPRSDLSRSYSIRVLLEDALDNRRL